MQSKGFLRLATALLSLAVSALSVPVPGAYSTMTIRAADPYGIPRPAGGETSVPLKTSYYIELKGPTSGDLIDSSTIRVQLRQGSSLVQELLGANFAWGAGCSGWVKRSGNWFTGYVDPTCVYVTTTRTLSAATQYKTRVYAASMAGAPLKDSSGYAEWSWTTEIQPATHTLSLEATLWFYQMPSTPWRGQFYSGLCTPSWCYARNEKLPSWNLLRDARTTYPLAWSLQRDFALTFDDTPGSWFPAQPNAVREQETRHIIDMQTSGTDRLLTVEDFFGHEQYGIADGRLLTGDYNAGDIVSICDSYNYTTASVRRVVSTTSTLLVSAFNDPPGGWVNYTTSSLPTEEDPNNPGLFPPGNSGIYLRKLNPPGTPKYYWGRVDTQLDTVATSYSRRVVIDFVNAPGDISLPMSVKAKNNGQLHQVVIDMTRHIIDRYGTASLNWYWGVFNEPAYEPEWRDYPAELQRFYDYVSDGVLRAFEDKWGTSANVKIGGFEHGGGIGWHPLVDQFLAHCGPSTNSVSGVVETNFCYADAGMNGKRSNRVETLCAANGGRGAPCDWLAIHTYHASKYSADLLTTGKQRALLYDPSYYTSLSICNFEAVPTWVVSPDYAAKDSFLGNGYFVSWCADVMARLVRKAGTDNRYSFGEGILTDWMWPTYNFNGNNDVVRIIDVDGDGDGFKDYEEALNDQIYNYVNLLATQNYAGKFRSFDETQFDQYVVGGVLSAKSLVDARLVLYAHGAKDTQSRSDRRFRVTFKLKDWWYDQCRVKEHLLSRSSNTFYPDAQTLRERASQLYTPAEVANLKNKAKLQVTKTTVVNRNAGDNNSITVTLDLEGNSVNFVVFEPNN